MKKAFPAGQIPQKEITNKMYASDLLENRLNVLIVRRPKSVTSSESLRAPSGISKFKTAGSHRFQECPESF